MTLGFGSHDNITGSLKAQRASSTWTGLGMTQDASWACWRSLYDFGREERRVFCGFFAFSYILNAKNHVSPDLPRKDPE